MSILDEILQGKAEEISARARAVSLAELKDKALCAESARGFASKLQNSPAPAIIAELKKASPSKGIICKNFDPVNIATQYAANGAACLSILTDEKYFQGHPSYVPLVRAQVPSLPILRKDFIIDHYQVWETKALGADCILLIVAALTKSALEDLFQLAATIELDILIEVHNLEELETALAVCAKHPGGGSQTLLGINNRNLKNFETTLETSRELMKFLSAKHLSAPELTIVSESGIFTGGDIEMLTSCGVQAFLIGESLLKAGEPGAQLKQLIIDSRALLN